MSQSPSAGERASGTWGREHLVTAPSGAPRRAESVENLGPNGRKSVRGRTRDPRPEAEREWQADERERPASRARA